MFHPFADQEEWELALCLMTSGISANKMDVSRMDFRLFEVEINRVRSGFECRIKIRLELKLS